LIAPPPEEPETRTSTPAPASRGAANGPRTADEGQESAPASDDLTERRRGEFTHADQAAVIARDLLTGRYVFARALGWLRWDGRRWRDCPLEVVRDEIAEHYRNFVNAEGKRILAAAGGDWAKVDKADHAYLASLKKLLSKAWLDAVTSLASGKVLVEATAFDAHPDLLNVANGVVDLTAGELGPHNPALLMRKITPVAYRPQALADPVLAQVLECIPDIEVRCWMQVRLGQAATGYVPPDDLLILLHGGGANGKSTLLGTVMKALGEYAAAVDDKVLLADTTSHSTERMELFGARLGLTEEVPGGRKLDMNEIKKIVGTSVMQARRMQRDPVTWQPTHALFITTNSQPIVADTDHGAWRRLAKVTFPLRYRPDGEPLEGDDDRRGDIRLRARMETGDPALLEAVVGLAGRRCPSLVGRRAGHAASAAAGAGGHPRLACRDRPDLVLHRRPVGAGAGELRPVHRPLRGVHPVDGVPGDRRVVGEDLQAPLPGAPGRAGRQGHRGPDQELRRPRPDRQEGVHDAAGQSAKRRTQCPLPR